MPEVTLDVRNKAIDAYRAFKTWRKQSKLKVVSLEMPLTSTEHLFGGTPDGIVEINHQFAIVDVKTSSGVYRDHLIQVAAYKKLWERTTRASGRMADTTF
jgi:hypothetical protein